MKRLSGLSAALAVGIGLIVSSSAIGVAHHRELTPLYDGVGFPDEPYRYVNPPAGSAPTKPVAGVKISSALLADGSNGPITLSTAEKGPQITGDFRIGVLQSQPGATSVTVELEPVTETNLPSNGTALANVYRATFTDDHGRPVGINGDGRWYVSMRIPKGTRDPVAIELLADGAWTTLRTSQTGADVYSAYVPSAGEVVPVLITASGDLSLAATAGRGGSSGLVVALVVAVIVIAGVTIFTMRTRALRLAQPPSGEVSEDVSSGGSSD